MSPQPYFMTLDEMNMLSGDIKTETLSEITDVLAETMLSLDVLGHKKWADRLGDILGDIFTGKND